jgi:hypothetical protein
MSPLPIGIAATALTTGLVPPGPAWSLPTRWFSRPGLEPSLLAQGTDQQEGHVFSLAKPRTGPLLDSVLDELAEDADRLRRQEGAETTGSLALPRAGIVRDGLARLGMGTLSDTVLDELAVDAAEMRSQTAAGRPGPSAPPLVAVPLAPVADDAGARQDQPGEPAGILARLAVTMLTAGLWGRGLGILGVGNRQAGGLYHQRRSRSSKATGLHTGGLESISRD